MASTLASSIGGVRVLSSLAAFSYSGASLLQWPHLVIQKEKKQMIKQTLQVVKNSTEIIRYLVRYQPGGIKLHQNDVSIINHIIEVVLCQHQCGLWWRFPVRLCNFFNSLDNSWMIKHAVNLLVCNYLVFSPCHVLWSFIDVLISLKIDFFYCPLLLFKLFHVKIWIKNKRVKEATFAHKVTEFIVTSVCLIFEINKILCFGLLSCCRISLSSTLLYILN